MSQETLTKLECVDCHQVNYHTTRNKKTIKAKLELKKYCRTCKKHTAHKETK